MRKLLLNSNGKALVGSNGKAYAVDVDVLSGDGSATFQASAGKILRLIRYGKCTQNGTPTPSAPVDIVCNNGAVKWGVSGTNLLDMTEENIRLRYYINDSGVEGSNNQNFYNTKFIPVKPNTTYTLSVNEPVYYLSIMEYDSNKGFLRRTLDGNSNDKHASTTFTTRVDTAYILIGSNPNRAPLNTDDVTSIDWMLNEGSTALPYEPYEAGIIVDGTPEVLSVAGQTASVVNLYQVGDYTDTQDIISGAVTRKVGVKALTGEETMQYATSGVLLLTIYDILASGRGLDRVLCSHYRVATSGDHYVNHNYANKYVYMHDVDLASLADWKAYLAAQYAAGTPVIVIYPLEEETHEEAGGQALTTVAGSNTVTTGGEFAQLIHKI